MGYTRKDRMFNGMWPKSSKQFADRMETRVLKLGFGLGAALLSSGSSSSRSKRTYAPKTYPIIPNSQSVPSLGMSPKTARVLCIIFLIFAPLFQVLGYISYRFWGFWTFFSLIIFSTLAFFCVGFTILIADDTKELGKDCSRRFVIASIVVAGISLFLSLWPIFVKDSERTSFSYFVLIIEDMFLIGGTFALYYDSSVDLRKKKDQPLSVQLVGQPPVSKRTSRTVRITEMEDRYNKVKAALNKLEKAEEQLVNLSGDVDILRDY